MQRHKSSKILFMWLSYVQIKNSRVSRSIQVQGAKIDGKGAYSWSYAIILIRQTMNLLNTEYVKNIKKIAIFGGFCK
ncbi:MAG TPA: hypothetical protein PK941_08200 [Paludibacter sp.]|jgi:hypothetical protein|nr:hypothetical protein [Paludibacter sp.]